MGRVHTHGYVTKSELDSLIDRINNERDAYKRGADPVNVQKAVVDALEDMAAKNPFLSSITRQLSGIMGGLITPYLHDQGTLPYSAMFSTGTDFDGGVINQSLLSAKHMAGPQDEFTPNPRWVTPYKLATANHRRNVHKSGVTARNIADELETMKRSLV